MGTNRKKKGGKSSGSAESQSTQKSAAEPAVISGSGLPSAAPIRPSSPVPPSGVLPAQEPSSWLVAYYNWVPRFLIRSSSGRPAPTPIESSRVSAATDRLQSPPIPIPTVAAGLPSSPAPAPAPAPRSAFSPERRTSLSPALYSAIESSYLHLISAADAVETVRDEMDIISRSIRGLGEYLIVGDAVGEATTAARTERSGGGSTVVSSTGLGDRLYGWLEKAATLIGLVHSAWELFQLVLDSFSRRGGQ